MQATFTNTTSLALYGLSGSAQSYAAGAKTGIYPIQNFTDGSADGQYVDSNGACIVLFSVMHPSISRAKQQGRQTAIQDLYIIQLCCMLSTHAHSRPPPLSFSYRLQSNQDHSPYRSVLCSS